MPIMISQGPSWLQIAFFVWLLVQNPNLFNYIDIKQKNTAHTHIGENAYNVCLKNDEN